MVVPKKHRDLAHHHWHERYTELVERYPADELRCIYHRSGANCQHSITDHSQPHTMDECPFRDSDRVEMVAVPLPAEAGPDQGNP